MNQSSDCEDAGPTSSSWNQIIWRPRQIDCSNVEALRRNRDCASAADARATRYSGHSPGSDSGLWSGEIQQHNIRVPLHSFEDNFTPVGRDVKVANVEVG